MTNLYRASVSDHQFRQEGLGYFVQHGQPLTVGGDPMVRLSGGTLVPAAGWHSEFSDAVLEAAQRIEALGHRLLAQADRLRVEAAASAKPEVTA
jgi:hypothetical protein